VMSPCRRKGEVDRHRSSQGLGEPEESRVRCLQALSGVVTQLASCLYASRQPGDRPILRQHFQCGLQLLVLKHLSRYSPLIQKLR
jgi:hypothetical protein